MGFFDKVFNGREANDRGENSGRGRPSSRGSSRGDNESYSSRYGGYSGRGGYSDRDGHSGRGGYSGRGGNGGYSGRGASSSGRGGHNGRNDDIHGRETGRGNYSGSGRGSHTSRNERRLCVDCVDYSCGRCLEPRRTSSSSPGRVGENSGPNHRDGNSDRERGTDNLSGEIGETFSNDDSNGANSGANSGVEDQAGPSGLDESLVPREPEIMMPKRVMIKDLLPFKNYHSMEAFRADSNNSRIKNNLQNFWQTAVDKYLEHNNVDTTAANFKGSKYIAADIRKKNIKARTKNAVVLQWYDTFELFYEVPANSPLCTPSKGSKR